MMVLDDNQKPGACLKVVGVGGGGGNAISFMIESGIDGVQFIAANTDRQALAGNLAEVQIQLGAQRTQGLGAGSNPTVGQEAAQESSNDIKEQLKGADMVFVTAGMGGGTGTGAAPVIAGIARQNGALTVGIVTKPFKFEGGRRRRYAEEGIENLRRNVDTLITIPNERLLTVAGEQTSFVDAFKLSNSVLCNAVRSISELITRHGLVNTDFADVKTVMDHQGFALMGTGVAEGESRAVDAAEQAISSPLLDDITIDGASSILINITGPSTMSMKEISEAVSLIEEAASEDALIIWGQVINDESEAVKITIIATGFDRGEEDAGVQPSAGARSVPGQSSGVYSRAVTDSSGMYPRTAGDSGRVYSDVARGPYQDTLSSGSFPPADIASKLQEYDAQMDSVYAPSPRSSSYAPAPDALPVPSQPVSQAPDIFAPVSSAEPVPRPSSAPRQNDVDSDSGDQVGSDKPAYLRRGSAKRNFLDF